MGLRMFLFAPALLIMMVSIILGGANNAGANPGNLQSGANSVNANFCANQINGSNNCVPNGTSTVITCRNVFTPCKIAPNCIVPTPPPAWCFPWPFSLIPSNAGTWLNPGATVILNSNQFNSGISPNAAIFNFGSIGPSGWIIMIIIAVGIAALASITILNSGMGAEGVHVLILGALAVGIWGFLSLMDGFITGNPNSLFSGLNSITMHNSPLPAGIGTLLYVLLSLFWVFGWIGLIDRGA